MSSNVKSLSPYLTKKAFVCGSNYYIQHRYWIMAYLHSQMKIPIPIPIPIPFLYSSWDGNLSWTIAPPPGPISLIFMLFFAKIMPNNIFLPEIQGLATFLPRKSWICHCNGYNYIFVILKLLRRRSALCRGVRKLIVNFCHFENHKW